MQEFNFANALQQSIVPSGTRVSGSIRPELILASTFNKFILNDKAMRMMGLKQGDKVVIFDLLKAGNVTNVNERYYITKSFVKDSVAAGAKIGKSNTVSYSGVYGAMLIDDMTNTECNQADLIRAGKGLTSKVSGNFIATTKIAMEVVEAGEASPWPGIEPQMIYALKNFEFIAHEPSLEDEDVTEVDFEDEEDMD